MKIQQPQYSGINFDWVIVRELRLADNLESYDFGPLADLAADVQVQSRLDRAKGVCRTTVRLTISPPRSESFQAIAAAVEGQFSVAAGAVPSVDLEQFGALQAPAILMPFLRDAIAGLTAKTRFGQVLVPPINVVALMEEMRKAQAATPLPAPVAPSS